ncbi:bifunctional lysylphosphatidylglycerol flippase/synthetase MprF [Psychrobacter sanguinis]|uniref:bifunctional lysylphosphatidylglycerol flippase/synthetase MprF n=1 Tax=Psychrobacter sanguinis TaxID=861445 RepID=UPI002A750D92|nr:bifunctional lysylphosphatidylglycerol flippase/synthetase MprF [Psychrobacter sanguinis]MDY3306677.1 bifunctional lysylphosphatidylglycerol flippase/synthetase MprF [Psychrobacter sanguinis]
MSKKMDINSSGNHISDPTNNANHNYKNSIDSNNANYNANNNKDDENNQTSFNWRWIFALIAIAIFGLASKSLYDMLHSISLMQMKSIIGSTAPLTLFKALVVVGFAYSFISLYDWIAVRYLKAHLSYPKVFNTSVTAFAIGDSVGVSLLSAGAVRYRYYGQEEVPTDKIANIILLVSLAFTFGMMTVIGFSLAINPHMLSQLLTNLPLFSAVSPIVFRIMGVVILSIITALIVYAGKFGRVFKIKQWQLHLPPATVLTKLGCVTVIDFALMAYIIHLLLPANIHISYLEVFSAYVQSVTASIISSVPGGLGVFEVTMVASLPKVDKTTLLSILFLYRILYYLVPFILGIISFLVHEAFIRSGKSAFYRHLNPLTIARKTSHDKVPSNTTALNTTALNANGQPNNIAKIFKISPDSTLSNTALSKQATSKLTTSKIAIPKIMARDWVPQAMSLVVMITGMLMLIVSILPPDNSRKLLLNEFIPLPIIEASYLLNTLIGFVLIVLARGLYQRLNGAWLITMWLLGISIVTLLVKHLEYEIATVTILAFCILYLKRDLFNRQSTLTSLRLNIHTLMLLSIFLISLFWVGMYIHRHEPYNSDLWWNTTGDNGARFLRSYAVLVIASICYVLFSLIRFKKPLPRLPTAEDLAKAKKVIENSKYSVSNLSLLADKQLLFSDSGNSFIMYQVHGRSWIMMSDPIGDDNEIDALIKKFIELSQDYGGSIVFYEVRDENRFIYNKHGFQLLKIGEEAIVDLDDFGLQGRKNSKYRQIMSRGEKDGLKYEVIAKSDVATILPALKEISDIWLKEKGSVEKGFSLGYFDEDYLKNFDCAVVKYENNIIAFANLWQSGLKHELSIDLMRYKTIYNNEGKEIKNVMDFLFVNLFVWGKEQGFHDFNLGMAPFTGFDNTDLGEAEFNKTQSATMSQTTGKPVTSDSINSYGRARSEDIDPKWRLITKTVTKYGKDYYNFEGLRQFKDKYKPHWEPRYIGIETGLRAGVKPLQGLTDTTLLISGGLGSFVKK